jgi:hypothetical protein
MLNVTEIALRFGSSAGQPVLRFSPGPVTVFVGPNNSDKSLVLREIEEAIADPGDERASAAWIANPNRKGMPA